MNTAKEFNIRINFPPTKDRRVKQETVYHYYWYRIITVALLISALITALVSGALNYLKQQRIASENTAITTTQATYDSRPAVIYKAQMTAMQLANIEAAKRLAVTRQEITTQTQLIGSASNPSTLPTNGGAENSNAIAPKNDSAATQVQPISAQAALFTQSQTSIFSPHIKRFAISKTVRNREPVGTLNDINFDNNNIATLYAYSDAIDLKEETLYYKWSLDGKTIAKVRIDVWSDRWRSYSRKFIQPHMHGEWQVALQNKKGETLAINQFTY